MLVKGWLDRTPLTGYRANVQGKAAKLLSDRREELGLTQHEVAVAAGVRDYDVSRWERGAVRSLPLAGLRSVCRVLEIDLEELADLLLEDLTSGAGAADDQEASPRAAGDEAVEIAAARLEARRKRRRPGSNSQPES